MNHEPEPRESDAQQTEPAHTHEPRQGSARSASTSETAPNVLDLRAHVERPSTQRTDDDQPRQEHTPCDPATHPSRHTLTDSAANSAEQPGVRLLPPAYVPLDAEHRTQAVRALTDLIIAWLDSGGADQDTITDLDQAA